MNIGDKIYKIRKKNNLSQEEFAYKINVSRQTISKWELNQSKPEIDKVELLCTTFNVRPDYFINGSNSNEIESQQATTNLKYLKYFIVLLIISICISIGLIAIGVSNSLLSIVNVITYSITIIMLLRYIFNK